MITTYIIPATEIAVHRVELAKTADGRKVLSLCFERLRPTGRVATLAGSRLRRQLNIVFLFLSSEVVSWFTCSPKTI